MSVSVCVQGLSQIPRNSGTKRFYLTIIYNWTTKYFCCFYFSQSGNQIRITCHF